MSDYGTDVAEWSGQQALLLRRRAVDDLTNDTDLDWPNIAHEIESPGAPERFRIRIPIATMLEHLIKPEASPSIDPRNCWKTSIVAARRGILRTLEDSPSLRREVPGLIQAEMTAAREDVAATLAIYGEQPRIDISRLAFSEEQVTGPWFPDDPA
jgi:hypothetical protein